MRRVSRAIVGRAWTRACSGAAAPHSAFQSRLGMMGGKAGREVLAEFHSARQTTQQACGSAPSAAAASAKSDPLRDLRSFGEDDSDRGQVDDAVRRKRLLFQARYRGMHEMDLIFGSFAADCIVGSSAVAPELVVPSEDLHHFDAILREYDNDLNHWLVEIEGVCREHGLEVPVAAEEGGNAHVRGAVPARLHGGNPVWEKLVRYVSDNKARILAFRS